MGDYNVSGFGEAEGEYTFNMSIETLKRMNNILILMNTYSIEGQFNEWRIACETLANELSPFFDSMKEVNTIDELTKIVEELNDAQIIYNVNLENGENSGETMSRFRTCLTAYDRRLRKVMLDLKLLMHKGEDMGGLMGKQY